MIVLGLTGSIGMGKTTTAALFRAAGVLVHDADAAVHALYRGEAAPLVEAAFPGTTSEGVVDRHLLSQKLMEDSSALARLETIVHPLVRKAREQFLDEARQAGASVVVLDVPLLFETGGDRNVDAVVLVTAPESVQKARVLARPGMTQERFAAILTKQMPDSEKRKRAHFIVDTSLGFAAAERQVQGILRALSSMSGQRK
jgi:dephospho-CoA kinase